MPRSRRHPAKQIGRSLREARTTRHPARGAAAAASVFVGVCLFVWTCSYVAGTPALAAAPPDLNVAVTNVDTSAFPRVSAVVQLGGPASLGGGTLDARAFTVLADGAPVQKVDTQATQSQPLASATVLLIDESGSMREAGAIGSAALAARRFIDAMRAVDRVSIQAFNEDFRVLQGFTSDKGALVAPLQQLAPQKETALYDALTRSLETLAGVTGAVSRNLILLSDGGDTKSTASLDQAVAGARASGVQVYTVGLKTTEFDSRPLAALAEATGGRYLETPNPEALSNLYAGLAREIQNQYVLSFDLPETSRGKGAGDLVVKVNIGGVTGEGARGLFYPAAVLGATPQPTSAPAANTAAAPTAAIHTLAGPGWVGTFVDWSGSGPLMALVTFALLLVALFTLSRVLFPRRNVLEEYSDILDNRRNLGPKSAAEEQPRPGERFVTRLLSRRGYLEPIQERIEEAGWPLRTSEFVMLHLGSVALVIVVVLAFSAPLVVSLPIVVMAAITPLLLLNHKAKQRRQEFETQVPDTLVLMANSLRAGQGFEQALRVVADEGSDPTAQEFQRLLAQQRLGVPPEDTLRSLADRMKSEAFDWAVMATIIQRQVGGNLAEIYEKIAETIRGREVLRREIRTLTAEGRFSAFILVVLPFGIGGVIASIRPEYASLLWTTKAGLTMLGCALVAMVIGILWIRRIIRFDT